LSFSGEGSNATGVESAFHLFKNFNSDWFSPELNCDSSLPPSALLNTYVQQFFVVLFSSSLSLERLYTYMTERGPNTETEDENGIMKNAPIS
jgi:hypothetical protein